MREPFGKVRPGCARLLVVPSGTMTKLPKHCTPKARKLCKPPPSAPRGPPAAYDDTPTHPDGFLIEIVTATLGLTCGLQAPFKIHQSRSVLAVSCCVLGMLAGRFWAFCVARVGTRNAETGQPTCPTHNTTRPTRTAAQDQHGTANTDRHAAREMRHASQVMHVTPMPRKTAMRAAGPTRAAHGQNP